jgi:tRNA A37 threonylcarbamoyladenosine dehydratase
MMTDESRPEISSKERFSRIELMLGRAACERLGQAGVMVAGLGAVGSYATEGLARAGIGRLWLVDFDRLAPSNINRHLLALGSTVGQLKSEAARERVREINPECRVQAIQGFIGPETVKDYLAEGPDLVIDAIDSLNPKVELIAACRSAEIPLICCLGAALRFDPAQVRIGTLEEVKSCHLARAVRKRLRRRGVPLDFPCVYSLEPLPHPLPIAAPTDPLGEEPALDRGRTRHTLGSLPTLPGIFGLTAANLALRLLTGR